MNQITLKAYGKINMSLDVKNIIDDGYHEVEMVIQGIKLHDEVKIKTLQQVAFLRILLMKEVADRKSVV